MQQSMPYIQLPGGGGFNPYAAGNKQYGAGRSFPTMGPVDPLGYQERDRMQRARQNAIVQRLKAMQSGNYMSSAYLGGIR